MLPTLVPPQTYSDWPVTKPLSGDAKNTTARATSSGRPTRPTGIFAALASSAACSRGITSWNMSVTTGPGATTFVSLTARGRGVAGPLIEAAREHERAVLEPFGERNSASLVGALQSLIDRNR
jgi:hypothetical protein